MEIILEMKEAVQLLKDTCMDTCCNDCPYTYGEGECRLYLSGAKEPWHWNMKTTTLTYEEVV